MTETTKFEMASRGLMANPALQLEAMEKTQSLCSVERSLAWLYVSKQINKKELELLITQATAQGYNPEKLKKRIVRHIGRNKEEGQRFNNKLPDFI